MLQKLTSVKNKPTCNLDIFALQSSPGDTRNPLEKAGASLGLCKITWNNTKHKTQIYNWPKIKTIEIYCCLA